MTFAREVLGIPAPRVLAWNNTIDNEVGTAYIIMEYVEGEGLRDRWPSLIDGAEAVPHVTELLAMETAFEKVSFSQIGSLYFTEDVEPALRTRPLFSDQTDCTEDSVKNAAKKYRIGPIAERAWWKQGQLQADRGPCAYSRQICSSVSNACPQGLICHRTTTQLYGTS